MASSLFKVAILFFLFGGLASASPYIRVNAQVQKRDLLISNTLPEEWQSVGCYYDGSPAGRTLQGSSYVNATAMTEESCVSFCDAQGYFYAGVEYSQECYCGNYLAVNTPEPITDCQMACKGNSTEACGGGDRLNVFWNGKMPPAAPQTNLGPPGWTLLGCYTAGNTEHILGTGVPVPGGPGSMTVEVCTSACSGYNFIYAGVEYAQECYCGNAISDGGVPAPGGLSECNMPCAGNISEYCGAGYRLDLYQLDLSLPSTSSIVVSTTTSSDASPSLATTTTSTTAPTTTAPTTTALTTTTPTTTAPVPTGPAHVAAVGNFNWIGCYTEATNSRALIGAHYADYAIMTVEVCQSYCASQGSFSMFGVEYGGECYCGNSLQAGSDLVPTPECSMTCDGNKYEYCGAGNRLDVYQTAGTSTSSSATSAVTTFTVSSTAI